METQQAPLRVATFEADVTPPIGGSIYYGDVAAIDDPLSCRGILLLPDGLPIVLASVDWLGIYNGGHDAWRYALANAAGTAPERVAVHTVHQHETPGFDADAEKLLLAHGIEDEGIDASFAYEAIGRAADAVREAVADPTEVTHLGVGASRVEKVASNRQLLGEDGTCIHTRSSAERDPEWREAPEGVVDPELKMISFWRDDEPVAALSYYATHPQSYYRDRRVTCDFVGLARNQHEDETGVPQIHFNGAAGNVTAGKYNDGAEARRPELAERLASGMAAAWTDTDRSEVAADGLTWTVKPVELPPAERFDRETLVAELNGESEFPDHDGGRALAWFHRCENGREIDVACLSCDGVRVLHMPGELFVEYQIAAQRMRPDDTVAMAAYGDLGPSYIGTRAAYPKGGYEVDTASHVAPAVEDVLTSAMRDLLDAEETDVTPSDVTAEKPRISR